MIAFHHVRIKVVFPKSRCVGVLSPITAMVLCARSQDSALSVSVRRVGVVFSTAGFKGEGKPRFTTLEKDVLRGGIQKASCT